MTKRNIFKRKKTISKIIIYSNEKKISLKRLKMPHHEDLKKDSNLIKLIYFKPKDVEIIEEQKTTKQKRRARTYLF